MTFFWSSNFSCLHRQPFIFVCKNNLSFERKTINCSLFANIPFVSCLLKSILVSCQQRFSTCRLSFDLLCKEHSLFPVYKDPLCFWISKIIFLFFCTKSPLILFSAKTSSVSGLQRSSFVSGLHTHIYFCSLHLISPFASVSGLILDGIFYWLMRTHFVSSFKRTHFESCLQSHLSGDQICFSIKLGRY